jgi:CubicO group peptidase (beta-lactamase class C family)
MIESPSIDAKQLSDIAAEAAAAVGVVGAQVALLQGDEITQGVTGTANMATGTPVTDETIFSIGSTTKVFNAALALSLVDEGKLDLDAPVDRYIRGYMPGAPGKPEDITLRRLLSMTAGLDNGTYSDHGANADSVERYVHEQMNIPLVGRPGTHYGYSNAGTVVAGLAAEKATGQAWDDLLRERLLEPAGLANTETLVDRVVHHPVAVGYKQNDDGSTIVEQWHLNRGMGPAGVITATAADLVKFAALLLDHGNGVLSSSAVDIMHTEVARFPDTLVAQGWGVGPFIKRWNNVTLHGHSGTTSAGSSYLVWIPSHQVALATVVNTPRAGYPFADRVMKHVLGEGFGLTPPPAPQQVSVASSQLERCEGVYVAFGVELHIAVGEAGDCLEVDQVANFVSTDDSLPRVRLLPIGLNRFVATEPHFSGGRGWGTAFIGDEDRPTHFLNGVFLARRIASKN